MSRSVCLHDIIITSVSHWSHLHLLLLPCVWHIGCPQSSEQILTTEPQISKISTLYSVLPFQSSMEGNCGAGRRRIRRGGAGEHVSELFLMPGCTFIFQKSQRQFGYKLPAAWTHAHTHTHRLTHILSIQVLHFTHLFYRCQTFCDTTAVQINLHRVTTGRGTRGMTDGFNSNWY